MENEKIDNNGELRLVLWFDFCVYSICNLLVFINRRGRL